MAFFDDYAAGLEAYPETYLELAIVDLDVPGTALNRNETGTFKVKVVNNGPLLVQELQLKITGKNGTLVKDVGAAAPFVSEFISGNGQVPEVPAHDGEGVINTGTFSFQVGGTSAEADLFEVSVDNWVADTAHLHRSHSRPSPATNVVHRDRVRAA